METPPTHFAIDPYDTACGAEVPNLTGLSPDLRTVTCSPCKERLRSLKPNFDGLPLDIELDAELRVTHSTLRLTTRTLSIEHRWIYAGLPRFRLTIEDMGGHPLAENALAVEVGWRLPATLSDFLYRMDQRRSYTAHVVYGRTRGGAAPRCAFVQGVPPNGRDPMTCKGFISETDPRFKSDAEHLAHEIATYFAWMLQEPNAPIG